MYLSDNVEEKVNYLEERFHFLGKFRDGIFSYNVNLRKPDKRIYELVLDKTSHPAEECVFIDDKEIYLTPARKMAL